MPHISLPKGLPGIIGPLTAYPDSRKPLNDLADAVLAGPSSLSKAERELIASFVSSRNQCRFCASSHSAAARHLFGENSQIVEQALCDPDRAPISEKMRALLAIAEKARQDGRFVTSEDVQAARSAGADDRAIHDTVLITGMFCMFNRYVDGLATWTPRDAGLYDSIGKRIALHGYGRQCADTNTHKEEVS